MDISINNIGLKHTSWPMHTPTYMERETGLWVDIIGRTEEQNDPGPLRILGEYGAVAVERGKGWLFSPATGKRRVKAGQVMVMFPDEPSRYHPIGKWVLRWILWDGPETATLQRLGLLSPERAVVSSGADAVCVAQEELGPLMNRKDLASVLGRKTIVLNMLRACHSASPVGGHKTNRMSDIERVVSSILNSLAHPWDGDKMASLAHMSKPHFRRVFKTCTGRPPRDFLITARIAHAKRMLCQGECIDETAQALGYQDVFYFMRQFKKVTGIPPGRYQRLRSG